MFKVVSRYADFTGRTSRKRFWYFHGLATVLLVVVALLDINIQLYLGIEPTPKLLILSGLLLLPPLAAIYVRRLHDIGKNGWWFLLWVWVGGIFTLVIGILPGNHDKNIFGDAPVS